MSPAVVESRVGVSEGKPSLACPSCRFIQCHKYVAPLPSWGKVLAVNVLANVSLTLADNAGQLRNREVHGSSHQT